jgi:hypothetical protein
VKGAGLLVVFLLVGAALPGLVILAGVVYGKALNRFTPKSALNLPRIILPPEEGDEDE